MTDLIGNVMARPLLVDAQEIERLERNAADPLDCYILVSWYVGGGNRYWRMDRAMYETEDAVRQRVKVLPSCHRLAVIFRLRVERP